MSTESEIFFPLPPDTLHLNTDLAKAVLYDLTADALRTIGALARPPVSAYTQGELSALRRSMAGVLSRAYGVNEDESLMWVGEALEAAQPHDEPIAVVEGLLRRRR